MSSTIIFAVIGCLGGLMKSLVGIFKAKARDEKIKLGYMVRTLKLSAFSGTLMGAIFGYNFPISFVAGYIGSDLLEGVYIYFKHTKFWKKQFNLK